MSLGILLSIWNDIKYELKRDMNKEDFEEFSKRVKKRNKEWWKKNKDKIKEQEKEWKERNKIYYKKKYKRTYNRYNLPQIINGKKVKYYMQVYFADDAEGDEFIPIYYKRKKRKKNKENFKFYKFIIWFRKILK